MASTLQTIIQLYGLLTRYRTWRNHVYVTSMNLTSNHQSDAMNTGLYVHTFLRLRPIAASSELHHRESNDQFNQKIPRRQNIAARVSPDQSQRLRPLKWKRQYELKREIDRLAFKNVLRWRPVILPFQGRVIDLLGQPTKFMAEYWNISICLSGNELAVGRTGGGAGGLGEALWRNRPDELRKGSFNVTYWRNS